MANTNPYSSQYNPRKQLDATKQATIALPLPGATANTNAVDLEAATPFPSLDLVDFLAIIGTANANNGNATNINVQLQHSAVNISANFVNLPGTAAISLASNGASYPGTTIALPVGTGLLQFVRLQVTQEAAGANSANAANVTFALSF